MHLASLLLVVLLAQATPPDPVELSDRAMQLHKDGRAQRDPALLQQAAEAYEAWLTDFAEHERAYALRYAYGELLYAQRRYGEALEQYLAVVEQDPAGRHSHFCAESAVFAAKEMMKAEAPEPGAPPTPGLLALDRAVDAYLAHFADHEKAWRVAFSGAWAHYERGDGPGAIPRFDAVIAMDPTRVEAARAADLVLELLARGGDPAVVADKADAYVATEGLGTGQDKAEWRAISARARAAR